MENFDSLIILREIDYHGLKFNPEFESYENQIKGYIILSEKDEKLNSIKLMGNRKILSKVYIRNPLSDIEFLEVDYNFDFEKEYEHKLKMLFKILGAKYYNRILINGEVEKIGIDINVAGEMKTGVSNPLVKTEAEAKANLSAKVKKENTLMRKSKHSEEYKIISKINPKEAYQKAYKYAQKNNLLVLQDIKNLLEDFDPSLSSSRPTVLNDLSISFDSITRVYEAGISLGTKCGLILGPKKVETSATQELNFGINFIYNKNKDVKKVRKIEVHFDTENE